MSMKSTLAKFLAGAPLVAAVAVFLTASPVADAGRDGSGNYTLPTNSFSQPVAGTPISPTDATATFDDWATTFTDSLSRTGKGGMLSDLDLGSHKVTGLSNGTASTDAINLGQLNFANVAGSWSCPQAPAFTGDVTTTAGSCVNHIAALAVTNGMLAGSIAASKLIGTDIATVGTITSGIWNAGAVTTGALKVKGSTSGTLAINCAATCGTNTLTLPAGTTDLSATGGSNQFVKQSSAGGPLTVGTIGASDLPVATTSAFGAVKPDGTTITVSGGVITASGASATAVTVGTTNIVSGTSGSLLYNNGGVLGNQTISSALGTRATLPTVQRFTSGSGTYTTPAGVLWIEVTLVGGGAGGGGGNSVTASSGGGATCWNTSGAACTSSLYQANGGSGASSGGGGAGGGVGGAASCTWSVNGGSGSSGIPSTTAGGSPGGAGGNSSLGGGGGSNNGSGGSTAGANSGSGGAGGGITAAVVLNSGSGGGAGGTCYVLIPSPASNYTYAVGTGGGGASGGTNGAGGGNGGAGLIIVIEHYN